jgi:hypothetical protein
MHAAFSRLSSLEREEYKLLPKHFEPAAKLLESDATTPPDIARVATSLGSFIGDVRETAGAAASPRVICVCAAALRATDVARAFAPVKCGVAKLFAKHFKVSASDCLTAMWSVCRGAASADPARLLCYRKQSKLSTCDHPRRRLRWARPTGCTGSVPPVLYGCSPWRS